MRFPDEKLQSQEYGRAYKYWAGEEIKLNVLAKLIKEIVGFDGEIKHDLSRPDGTPRKLLDISRIKSIGWMPKTSLQEGIRKTYSWYKHEVSAE